MSFKSNSLTPEVRRIVQDKATESPFTGEYENLEEKGTFLCRQCGLALFRSDSKFHSGCGWPSFDNPIADHVREIGDRDGRRTEILCARCQAHLGHVFQGEGFTAKNIRHCVNSASLDFVASTTINDTEEAIFAAGCFWGVEFYFQQLKGVLNTEVGYIGGSRNNPTYEQVCSEKTGHVEAIRVIYDPLQINYETVCRYFFEIHDPEQKNGQGPDLGEQYLSQIFYYDEHQKKIAMHCVEMLEKKGFNVATQLRPVLPFWRAEAYHQRYYEKQQKEPYCHRYTRRF